MSRQRYMFNANITIDQRLQQIEGKISQLAQKVNQSNLRILPPHSLTLQRLSQQTNMLARAINAAKQQLQFSGQSPDDTSQQRQKIQALEQQLRNCSLEQWDAQATASRGVGSTIGGGHRNRASSSMWQETPPSQASVQQFLSNYDDFLQTTGSTSGTSSPKPGS